MIHAIGLFVFASRAFFGLPLIIYYQVEAFVVATYVLLAVSTSAPASRHLQFFGLVVLLSVGVVASAIQASANFDQPFIYGILARRDVFVSILPAYFLVYRLNMAQADRVISWFVLLIKFYIVLAFAFSLVVSPEAVNAVLAGRDSVRLFFVDFSASLGGYRLKISPLPGFLFLVYFLSGRLKSRYDIVVLFLFIFWLVFFYGGRSAIASMIVLFVARAIGGIRSSRGMVNFGLSVLIVLLLTVILLLFIPGAIVESRLTGLSQAINAITGEISAIDDVSSLSRITQFFELSDILSGSDFILGLGQMSAHWGGGFEAIFGRFHPSDLGLFGFLAIYGVFGALLLILAVALVCRWSVVGSRGFFPVLIFLIVFTIPTGLAFFHLPFVLICMLILRMPHDDRTIVLELAQDQSRRGGSLTSGSGRNLVR